MNSERTTPLKNEDQFMSPTISPKQSRTAGRLRDSSQGSRSKLNTTESVIEGSCFKIYGKPTTNNKNAKKQQHDTIRNVASANATSNRFPLRQKPPKAQPMVPARKGTRDCMCSKHKGQKDQEESNEIVCSQAKALKKRIKEAEDKIAAQQAQLSKQD